MRSNEGDVSGLLYLRHNTVNCARIRLILLTLPLDLKISQALRKVFASSDRKRPSNQTASAPLHNIDEPVPPTCIQRDGGNKTDGDWDHVKGTLAAQQLDDNTGARRCLTEEEDRENVLTEEKYHQGNEVVYIIPKAPRYSDEATAATATAPSSTTNEPSWNFDRFLEEQRRKEIQHDDEKEKIFQKVRNAFETHVPASQPIFSSTFNKMTA